MGYRANLKDPKTFSEKVTWLILYYYPDYEPAYTLGDKNGLREYFLGTGLEKYLPPIVGVYNQIDEIEFDELPNSFVIKKSSASNMNAIIYDKDKIDFEILKGKLNEWMNTDYGVLSGERHYSKMKSIRKLKIYHL